VPFARKTGERLKAPAGIVREPDINLRHYKSLAATGRTEYCRAQKALEVSQNN